MHLSDKLKNEILSNLNVSVVMPFYKKVSVFKHTIKINRPYFARPGVEVILSIDEPFSAREVVPVLEQCNEINWRVFENHQPHDWRNPARAINVGIRNASKEFILVMGPDSEMFSDIIWEFRCRESFYPACYFLGKVAFITEDMEVTKSNSSKFTYFPYGSIFGRKEYFESVYGYNEKLDKWGGDDDNIRMRLSRSGLTKMFIDEAILLHRDKDLNENVERYRKAREMPAEILKQIFLDSRVRINDKDWGRDFDTCIYPPS
jgi:hypothetical protein